MKLTSRSSSGALARKSVSVLTAISPPEAGSGSANVPGGGWDRYRPQRLGVGALTSPEAGGTAIAPRGWEWER